MVFPRLFIIAVLIIMEVLWLLGSAVSETGAPEYEAYVVQQSDSLESIAKERNLSVAYLVEFNHLDEKTSLAAGQVILIPVVVQQISNTPEKSYAQATANTPAGNRTSGIYGVVTAPKAEIRSKPLGGQVIFKNALRGTELLIIGQSGESYGVLMADGSMGWIAKSTVALSETRLIVDRPEPMAATAPGRPDIIQTAYQYLGIPYQYGGRLPDTVDCSLLVQAVFARHGIQLPRTAAQQFRVGTLVDVSQLQAGDRLYFYDRSGKIGHTGIYIGYGRFIHASSNRGLVAIDDLTSDTYWKKYAGACR